MPINLTGVNVLIVVAPSGGGKNAFISGLFSRYPDRFTYSTSCTSKKPDGSKYEFVTREEFEKRIAEGYFIESEEYSGDLYGTPKNQFDIAKKEGRILVLEVETNGALNIRKLLAEQGIKALFIFIDSGDDISLYASRIRSRGRGEDEGKVARRLSRIPMELQVGRANADIIISNTGTEQDLLAQIEGCVFD